MAIAHGRELTERYTVRRYLGRGGMGTVVCATRKADGEDFAVKIVPKAQLNGRTKMALAREVVVLRELAGADNVVRFEEAFEDSKNVYIVTELCRGGDLHERLAAVVGRGFDEREVLELAVQILAALARLHQRSISHRDIKLENFCFATREGEQRQRIRLIDFGMCHWRKPGGELHSRVHCGTLNFASPEVVLGETYVPEESDLWSVGVVLYALVTGELPFQCAVDDRLRKQIVNARPAFAPSAWRNVAPELRTLVEALLARDPTERPSATEALHVVSNLFAERYGPF